MEIVPLKQLFRKARDSGKLRLSNCDLQTIPEELWTYGESSTLDRDEQWWKVEPLVLIDLCHNEIRVLDSAISKFKESLCSLRVSYNQISVVDDDLFGGFYELVELDLSHNSLDFVPTSTRFLKKLKEFNVSCNPVKSVPSEICELEMLTYLNLENAEIEFLPEDIGNLTKLTSLLCANNKIKKLPGSIVKLECLKDLDISYNKLQDIPSGLENLKSLTSFNASYNEIQEIHSSPPNLKQLNISFNQIRAISVCFSTLRKIEALNMRKNACEELKNLATCSSLKILDVSENPLQDLPFEFHEFKDLFKITVDNITFRRIPKNIVLKGTESIKMYLRQRGPIKLNISEESSTNEEPQENIKNLLNTATSGSNIEVVHVKAQPESIEDKIKSLEKELESFGITKFRSLDLKRQIALLRSQKLNQQI
jgi:Leucine-rich repeat (LRR) protein